MLRPRNSDSHFRGLGVKFQESYFGYQISDIKFRISNIGLGVSHVRVVVSRFEDFVFVLRVSG
jgi:hypothetical protein